MRYLLIVCAIIFSAFLFCSCDSVDGSGNVKTETRKVGSFDGVQVSGSMDIEVENSNEISVKIEADDNALAFIVAEVDNGLLDVYLKPNTSFNNVHAKVYVTAPHINKLLIKGSGNIVARNVLRSSSMQAKISGSGDIEAVINAPDVEANISGSGNLSLEGRCKNFEASISGSGDLKCKSLLSENAVVKIYGSGTAHVYSSVHLKASTAGSGDIYYSGNPASPDITKSGSGSVEPEE